MFGIDWNENHTSLAFLFVILGLFGTMRILFRAPHEKPENKYDDKLPPSDN